MKRSARVGDSSDSGRDDEDYASFVDLFSGLFFLMLLLVLMLFLLMGDGKGGLNGPDLTEGPDQESQVTTGGNEGNVFDTPAKQKVVPEKVIVYVPTLENSYSESLSEGEFAIGSAELPLELRRKISGEFLPRLVQKATEFGADTIEIIGHTDESPYSKSESSASEAQIALAASDLRRDFSTLRYSSNTELGMARALAVYKSIARFDSSLAPIKNFRVFSAGPFLKDGSINARGFVGDKTGDSSRRSITVRLMKSEGSTGPNSNRPLFHQASMKPLLGIKYGPNYVISEVIPNSPAYHSGISAGDRIFGFSKVTNGFNTGYVYKVDKSSFSEWATEMRTGETVWLFLVTASNDTYSVYSKFGLNDLQP